MASTVLKKEYENFDQLAQEFDSILSQAGMLLPTTEEIQMRSLVQVDICVEGTKLVEIEGEVVYARPVEERFEVGLEFRGEWRGALDQAKEKAEKLKGGAEGLWGKDSDSIFHRVKKMTTPEKIQLALKGGREERRVLMKDTHYMVHGFVLRNPRITLEEVAQISRMPVVTGEMIQFITSNSDWMNHQGIRFSIVKNPKTPGHILQKHVGKLNNQELLQLARSEHVRNTVSTLAKRTLASRGKPIR